MNWKFSGGALVLANKDTQSDYVQGNYLFSLFVTICLFANPASRQINFGGFMPKKLNNEVRFMRIKQLSTYTSLSRAYLYNLIKDSDFPNSISLKGIRMWEKSDVDSWLDKQVDKEVCHD